MKLSLLAAVSAVVAMTGAAQAAQVAALVAPDTIAMVDTDAKRVTGTWKLTGLPGALVGIDVLGLVAKKVSGKASFYDYLKTTIFDPLKMHDTDFVVPASKASRLTSVVAEVRTPGLQSARWPLQVTDDRKTSAFLRDRDIHSGGGGLVSTARDYARFCSMLVNNGTLDGARVLKPETLAIARSNLLQNNVRASIGGRNGFGAAMQVIMPDSARPGQEPAGSYGWFGIAGTQMFVDPTNKFSVVAMIQMQPTAVNLQADYKIAAYKDLAAVPA